MLAQHRPTPRTIVALMLLACIGCARGESGLWPAGIGAGSVAQSATCRAVLAPEQMRVEPAAPQPRLPMPLPPLPQRLDGQVEEARSWSDRPVAAVNHRPAVSGGASTGVPAAIDVPLATGADRDLDDAFGRLEQATQGMRSVPPEMHVDRVPRPTRLPSPLTGANNVRQPQDRAAARTVNQPPAVSPWVR